MELDGLHCAKPLACAAALLAGAAVLWPSAPAAAAQALTRGAGSIDFTAITRADATSFLEPQTILRATSDDGSERLEVKIAGLDLLVVRDVRPCLRASARLQGVVKTGVAQKIGVRWNGTAAAAVVDRGAEAPLEPIAADEFPRFPPAVLVSGSPDVTVRAIATNARPRLTGRSAPVPTSCFDPTRAAQGPAQASHRGIALRGMPDATRRSALEHWIDGMTDAMRHAVRSINVTDDGAQNWRGLAAPGAGQALFIRPDAFVKPTVFFHEGTHLLDGERGWRDSQAWGERFMGLPPRNGSFSDGALGHMDASSPGEQLAQFSGLANAEVLGYADARLCASEEHCAEKAEFLAARGYLSAPAAQMLVAGTAPLAPVPVVHGASEAAAPPAGARVPGPPSENPTYPTETIVPQAGSARVAIVLEARYFRPIDIYRDGGRTVHPTWRGCKAEDVMNRLSHQRPSAILSEPAAGGTRSYGYFDYGTRAPRRHYFALDEKPGAGIDLWLDDNGNGRLDDDGPARASIGKFENGGKGYATLLEFPWTAVMDEPPWDGALKLWFMSNPFEWSIAGFSKSSRSQLLGRIELAGTTYELIVADGAESDNDGDFRNDGLCLRKPGAKAVCYKAAEVRRGVLVDGQRYVFELSYR